MQPSEFISQWEAAVKSRNAAAIEALLATPFTLVSPVAHQPYSERPMALAILKTVLKVLPDLTYTRREAFPGGCLLVFSATIDGLAIEGIDLFDLDSTGRATQLKVMVRPLKATMLFAERMSAMLAKA